MKQKRTIAAAVLAILMFPSGLQAKDNTVPANYVPADLQSAGNNVPSDLQSDGNTSPSYSQPSDTVYTFRFISDRDMFYVPFNGNDTELARLEQCIERLKADILAGKIPLHVDGYSTSGESVADNLAMAKTRSNRVKSELIVRRQLTESCFITRNHSGSGDYVTVRIAVPEKSRFVTEQIRADSKVTIPVSANNVSSDNIAANNVSADTKPTVSADLQSADNAVPSDSQPSVPAINVSSDLQSDDNTVPSDLQSAGNDTTVPSDLQSDGNDSATPDTKQTDSYTIALRANLLRWATLTPDLGLEWRITPSVGIAVNGSWTSWNWNNADRRYALWEVAPEVRWYLGKTKCGYIGAMYKAGQFNYKLSATGKQGDLMGGGITGGYQLRLNKALSLDFNVAVGCLHADYETYSVTDGVRVRTGNDTKNWWGPVNAGVTLVWKIY